MVRAGRYFASTSLRSAGRLSLRSLAARAASFGSFERDQPTGAGRVDVGRADLARLDRVEEYGGAVRATDQRFQHLGADGRGGAAPAVEQQPGDLRPRVGGERPDGGEPDGRRGVVVGGELRQHRAGGVPGGVGEQPDGGGPLLLAGLRVGGRGGGCCEQLRGGFGASGSGSLSRNVGNGVPRRATPSASPVSAARCQRGSRPATGVEHRSDLVGVAARSRPARTVPGPVAAGRRSASAAKAGRSAQQGARRASPVRPGRRGRDGDPGPPVAGVRARRSRPAVERSRRRVHAPSERAA